MKTTTDTENWRNRYFDSLTALETKQQQFHAMETALKRLAGRLCTASLGQSACLDEQIKKLQNAIRGEVTTEELDQITPALTDAIQALDDSATPLPLANAPPPAAPDKAVIGAGDGRVQTILAALLAELKRDAELVNRADALDSKLTSSMTGDQLAEVLSSLSEMVAQRIKRIEGAKEEIEALLSHMVGKLDEIGQFVAEQHRSQGESHANSETLNVRLADEIKAMGESVESADDLQQIRTQVRGRIDSIDQHLQAFRQREATLVSASWVRNEQLGARIVELEAETKRLHQQLQAERQLSTIDVLTKIANRKAYDRYIEDELQRWRRFAQPTCIAVSDVDHFKRINDTYGHRAGDRVLRAVAECLAARIRGTDFVARYGGEEFVLILPGTQLDDAERVIEGMRTAIAGIGFHFRGLPVSITISSGVTALLRGDSAGTAFDRADKALYQAKETGRNRCVSAR